MPISFYYIIFIIIFSTLTFIKAENLNLQFLSANSKFQYTNEIPGTDGLAQELIDFSDKLLMVAVAPNLFMGPAQLRYRRVETPIEQVVTIKEIEYFPIKKSYVQKEAIPDIDGFVFSCPDYGFITLASNLLFKKLETEEIFDLEEYPVAQIVKDFKVGVGDFLVAVTLFEGKLEVRTVKVLRFSKCKNAFDPMKMFLLDEDEQICTQEVETRQPKYPQTIPSTLLFGKSEEFGFVFVGITSKTKDGVSLSTFVPYHCDFIKKSFKQELCV